MQFTFRLVDGVCITHNIKSEVWANMDAQSLSEPTWRLSINGQNTFQ